MFLAGSGACVPVTWVCNELPRQPVACLVIARGRPPDVPPPLREFVSSVHRQRLSRSPITSKAHRCPVSLATVATVLDKRLGAPSVYGLCAASHSPRGLVPGRRTLRQHSHSPVASSRFRVHPKRQIGVDGRHARRESFGRGWLPDEWPLASDNERGLGGGTRAHVSRATGGDRLV